MIKNKLKLITLKLNLLFLELHMQSKIWVVYVGDSIIQQSSISSSVLMIILVLFVGQHTFIWETLVEYGIYYLIMHMPNLSMLSFRLVLITVIQCYTTFQGAVFRDYREFKTRLPAF